jgi:hypothetical protein
MTDELAFALVIGIAAAFGAVVGRVFALEAEDRRTSILAAGYCGAGAGLMSGPVFAFLLTVVTAMLDQQSVDSVLGRAALATGPALLWGIAGGAGGGLLVGVLVALFKRCAQR